jgi:predicted N-formylglutamate amidohydrolase
VSATDWPAPVSLINAGGTSDIVLICEHASNHMPKEYGRLGVSEADLQRHIAWDIGAAAVTRGLSQLLDAPAFLGTYSRLLVDLNRPFGVPSSMPVRSECTDIPGNAGLTDDERQRRRQIIFEPFHAAVAMHLDERASSGKPTRLVTIHSFTPVFLGMPRPWHAGILYDRAEAFALRVIEGLSADRSLVIGRNVPYGIDRAEDYAVPIHGTDRGNPAILVEIRHDLIAVERGVAEWIQRLGEVLGHENKMDSRSN